MPLLARSGLSRCAFATRRCAAPAPALARLRTACFAAADRQRADLLKGVAADNRIAVSRAIEQAERAAARWVPAVLNCSKFPLAKVLAFSDFLAPPAAAEALQCIERLSGVSGLPWGGYVQAERTRLVLGNEEAVAAVSGDPAQAGGVAALSVRGNFMFDPATHRDFLGALLGTGIERQKVGDILVQGEKGAQILVVPELVDHLEFNLTQVRSVSVVTRAVPLTDLVVRAPKVQEMRSVEASLRLDAVASAGLRVSRAKAADLAKRGDLRVNWRAAKGSALVKAGDMISASGMGRLEVTDVTPTKKGRWAVGMVRYV